MVIDNPQRADARLADKVNDKSVNEMASEHDNAADTPRPLPTAPALASEIGGRKGPEPTRFGDWEKNGRCIDF